MGLFRFTLSRFRLIIAPLQTFPHRFGRRLYEIRLFQRSPA